MSEIDCDAAAEAAAYEYEMDCLKEEMEELRKDAARYRWICDGNGYFMEENMLCGHSNEKQKADEAIDAEMGLK